MDPDPPVPLLYRFLNTTPAAIRHGLRRKKCDRWAEAFDDWLAQREQERSKEARARSQSIWKKFLEACEKWPAELRREDIQAYQELLETRGYKGHSIRGYLDEIKAFFRFCEGRELRPHCKPFSKLPLPSPRRYSESTLMSREQVGRLLKAIDRHDSLFGKRDYAMIVMALAGGLRLQELVELRFEHVGCMEEDGEQRWRVRRRRGGREEEQPLAKEAAAAVKDWLLAAGRLPLNLEAGGDFVFPPISTRIASPAPLERLFRWSKGLSRVQAHDILRQYAYHCGMPWVTWHTIHHTAAWLRIEAGDVGEARSFLGTANERCTRNYLNYLNTRAQQPAEEGGASSEPWRRMPRAIHKGNIYGIKHGAAETRELGRLPVEKALERLRGRLIMLSVLEKHAETEDERLDLLQRMGFTAARILKLKQY